MWQIGIVSIQVEINKERFSSQAKTLLILRICCYINELLLNLSHQSHPVLETDFVSNSHLSGGGIAHAVQYLVEYFDLVLAQRIFKRNTQLVELVRELSGVNITLAIVVKCIDHHNPSFRLSQTFLLFYRFQAVLDMVS